ncbi:MAG: hypothetical protein ACREO5_00130, partial [Candidatus Binatia bacterium]
MTDYSNNAAPRCPRCTEELRKGIDGNYICLEKTCAEFKKPTAPALAAKPREDMEFIGEGKKEEKRICNLCGFYSEQTDVCCSCGRCHPVITGVPAPTPESEWDR